jgi:hypothetical protein
MTENIVYVVMGAVFVYWLAISDSGQRLLSKLFEVAQGSETGLANGYRWMKKKSIDPEVNILLRLIFKLVSSAARTAWLAFALVFVLFALFGKLLKGFIHY